LLNALAVSPPDLETLNLRAMYCGDCPYRAPESGVYSSQGHQRRLASRGEVLVQLTIICSDSEEGVYCPLRLFAVQVSMYLLERDSNVQMLRRDEPRPRLG